MRHAISCVETNIFDQLVNRFGNSNCDNIQVQRVSDSQLRVQGLQQIEARIRMRLSL